MLLPDARAVATAYDARRRLVDGSAVVAIGAKTIASRVGGFPKRQIDVPDTERAIFGPKDAFIEDLDTNVALLRRQLPDPELTVEALSLGTKSPRRGALLYLSDVANQLRP